MAIADVALEVGLAPERDRGGERDQGQRGGDLPEVDLDRGAHASTSLQRAGARSPGRPRSRTTQSPSRRAWSGSWLTRTIEISSSRRSSASVASIASRAAWSSAEVGSSSSRTSRLAGPAPGPASPAAARRPRAWRRRARRSGVEAGELAGSARDVELARRRARRRSARFDSTVPSSSAGSCGTSETSRRSSSGSQLGQRPVRGRRSSPRSGSASRLSSRSRVDLPLPEARRSPSPPRDLGADRVEDRRPPRARLTSRSSNSTGAMIHASRRKMPPGCGRCDSGDRRVRLEQSG